MSDKAHNFHIFALRSMLFKGRTDWYISYLKAERITQVLLVLSEKTSDRLLTDAVLSAENLPESIAYFAAGEMHLSVVLAEVFTLLSAIRLAVVGGALENANAQVLIAECEGIAERLGSGTHPSPFISAEDFTVPTPSEGGERESFLNRLALNGQKDIKDISDKGQTKGQNQSKKTIPEGQRERSTKILEIVLKNNGVSVRDIAKVVHGCSEKTIQRELALLIEQGLVKKMGERRWSLYVPVKSL